MSDLGLIEPIHYIATYNAAVFSTLCEILSSVFDTLQLSSGHVFICVKIARMTQEYATRSYKRSEAMAGVKAHY